MIYQNIKDRLFGANNGMYPAILSVIESHNLFWCTQCDT